MKRLYAIAVLFLLAGCSTVVPPGWEGIKVNNVGSRRGVEKYPIETGRVFFNPLTEDVYKYPISKQNYIWEANESITFNSVEGTSIQGDVGAVFNVKPGATPALFTAYRQNIEALTDGVIRNEVRDALNRAAGEMKVMEIIGPKKAELLDEVKQALNDGPLGSMVDFETISFVHAPKPDPGVQAAINSVITAMNSATAAEQKVREAIAVAEQLVATARGDSASAVIRATGTAEANRRITHSLTETIIRYELALKWDGKTPQVASSSNPTILFNYKGQ